MSLQLVLAGLFPPSRELTWLRGFNWQPIPYNYESIDRELQGHYICPNYSTLKTELLATPKLIAINAANQWVYDILTNGTGTNTTSQADVFDFYFGLQAQSELGFPLPDWSKQVFPEPMKSITVDYYYTMTNTTALKRIIAGHLLKKIITDSAAKINGTLSPSEKKLFLYSAHEMNVAAFLITLGVFDPDVPAYGSYVLLELHQIEGIYGIKLYRHGHRTPDQGSLWESNAYYNESYYWPYGYGQLTNQGKRREFSIGLALRQRYNKFLGETYNINLVEPRTTNFNRTKMSLQLVLSGLFPPSRELTWLRGFNWQPVPYNYLSIDRELQGHYICPNFSTLKTELLSTPKLTAIEAANQWVYDILTNETGTSITSQSGVFNIYFGLQTQLELGYPLPEWTKQVFPEPMKSITVDYYYTMTNTTALKRIIAGQLLKKILEDSTAKINGTLSPSERKLFLYSAHEMNVASFLITLGVFEPDVPAYGSYVLVELHQIEGIYGIKLFYQDYSTSQPKLLVIPGCEEFCPFDQFSSLVSEVIPDDEDCGL